MPESETRPSNRLAGETSPYLLQHAHNPVDWYPWGEEALERARAENRPILLSIGYAACHWCHVMERESFENAETARIMSERFVCIKVDREERPDIDSIYMDALTAMSGRGGWPMTMFLTPDGKPFFGGTYFPPKQMHGMPSFREVLDAVHEAWLSRREEIGRQSEALVEHIQARTAVEDEAEPAGVLLQAAARSLEESFDPLNGGFGPAPKFPQAPVLELLLRTAGHGYGESLPMMDLTLRKMALGGMYDQIGGGFHRYSVDERWLVPHFEKMLYDNAQLARVYTRAWQLTGDALFRRIAEETLDYLIRDMTLGPDQGGLAAFFASEDADSEGEEGKFYVWDHDEFTAVAPEAADYYGVTREGNFEGHNILTGAGGDPPLTARDKLLRHRSRRVHPGRDEKILVSWNALAISALAEASAAFGRPDLRDRAGAVARFLLSRAIGPSGRLMHSYKDGRATVPGMLEDYAYLSEALLTLWEVTFAPGWLEECRRLSDEMLKLFSDPERGDFYSTGEDHEKLIVRPKELIDGATPSPNGVASLVLQKLAVLTGDKELASRGAAILKRGHAYMARAPQAAGTLLCALDFYLSTAQEIVIVGSGAGAEALKEEVWRRFLPNKVLAGATDPAKPGFESPMMEAKQMTDGLPTAFLCENYSCRAPTTDPEELGQQLSASLSASAI